MARVLSKGKRRNGSDSECEEGSDCSSDYGEEQSKISPVDEEAIADQKRRLSDFNRENLSKNGESKSDKNEEKEEFSLEECLKELGISALRLSLR